MSNKDRRIQTSFKASLVWAFISMLLVVIAVLVIGYSEQATPRMVGFALLVFGGFFAFQSYRQLKLFYPGALLLSTGIYMMFLAPVFHSPFMVLLGSVLKLVFGAETTWVKVFLEKFPSVFPKEITSVDVFCAVVGLLIVAMGVLIYRSEAQVNESISEDFTTRVR